jgi:hypothetical protein
MNVHYDGGDWRKEHKKRTKEFNNLFLEEREYYGDLPGMAERMMEGYLNHYKDVEKDWEVLSNEQTYIGTFDGEYEFSFKPDLIIRDHSTPKPEVWIVDHKTVKSLPSSDWRMEDLQSTLYHWAIVQNTDLNPKGFLFNYIRRKAPTVPKVNKDGSISKARIDTDYFTMASFLLDYYQVDSVNKLPKDYKVRLRNLKLDNRFLKRSKLIKPDVLVSRQLEEFGYTVQEMEVWHEIAGDNALNPANKDEDPWVRTMIPSCEWDCEYHDLCMVELLGQDSEFIRKRKYQPSKYTEDRGLGSQR